MRGTTLCCLPVVLSATRAVNDEDGLLSLKNQRMTLDAGLGMDLMSAATERNVTQMQALVQSLVEESIQGDGVANMDDDIQQALKIIKSTLLDGIRNTLKTEHKQDQDAIMEQLKCFDTCQKNRDGAEANCDSHRLKINELRTSHVECRNSLKIAYVDKVKKCNALDDWVEAFRLSAKVLESCVYGEEYECRTSKCAAGECEPDIDGRFGAWLKQIITEAKEGYRTWLELHNTCKASYHAYIEKDSSCDVTQADFQSKVCELGQCEYTACKVEFTRCRADCIAAYHREVKRVECAEKDRKIDWSATEKIECYIGILLASPTDDELKAACHDDMTNCISTWRTAEYDKCNDVCKEIDFESGGYSQHDRRGAAAGDSLYDHRRAHSDAGVDNRNPSTQGARQLADNEVAGDRTAGVNTTHRGDGEHLAKRCTSHLDIDFQPIPCAKPCDDLPDLPCSDEFINTEYAKFLRPDEVAEVADKRTCHSGEHSEKWAYNLCECPQGKNPPVGTFFCPIVGTPSITEDDYCVEEPPSCGGQTCTMGVIACGGGVWNDRDYVFTNPPAQIDGATLFIQPHKSLAAGTYTYAGLPVGGVVFLAMEKEHHHRDGGIVLDSSWTHMSSKVRWHSSTSSDVWYKTITESTLSVTKTSKQWVGYVAFHGPSKAAQCALQPKVVDVAAGWSTPHNVVKNGDLYMGPYDLNVRTVTKKFAGLGPGCTYTLHTVLDGWQSVDNEAVSVTINGQVHNVANRGATSCVNGWTQYPRGEANRLDSRMPNHGSWVDCWKKFSADFTVGADGHADVTMAFDINQHIGDEAWGWHDMVLKPKA